MRSPQATLAGLPPHIPPVLEVALAKDPKDRFPDAVSFLDALQGTTAATDVAAPDKSGESALRRAASSRSPRSKRKWLTYFLLGGLGVAALVVVLVVALGGSLGAQ